MKVVIGSPHTFLNPTSVTRPEPAKVIDSSTRSSAAVHLRQGFEERDDGNIHVPIENIWDRVRAWAKRNGHEYEPTYGIVGVDAM